MFKVSPFALSLHSSSVMKTGLMSATINSQEVRVDMEPLPSRGSRGRSFHSALSNVRRSHSRSASWSLPGGQGSRPSEFGRSLASLNPMTPITNVIREIVPSFGQLSQRASETNGGSSPHLSRNPSQTSLLLGNPEMEGGGVELRLNENNEPSESPGHDPLRTLGDSSSNVNVHLPHEHTVIPIQGPPEDQNVGLELSDSMRWLERNAIFIILLLIKFAWYHRSGLLSPFTN